MESADLILVHGTVVTMDAQFAIIHDGAVAIRGSHIVDVGTTASILTRFEAPDVVDCTGRYVLPGLVNAHTHAPMTLLRGLADDLRLDVWLIGYCMPTEREFVTPEFCRLGTLLACAEMIRGGVTCFADMYYYEKDIAAATAEAGLRGVLGQTVLKYPSPDAESYEDSLRYAESFIQEWKDHPLITPALAPHAPYTTTQDILHECATIAIAHDVPVLIHIAEMKLEQDDSVAAYGQPVVPWVRDAGLLKAKVVAAHCVHIDRQEMRLLREHDTTVAHCPTSNLKLASGIAPVQQFLQEKLTVGIGTDGPASNNDLDMFEEVRLAAILAKTAANDPTALPAQQALLMATRMGAEALYLGDVTGSLEVGKYADLIVIDGEVAHNIPRFQRDPQAVYSRLVYASKSSDVRHVLCHGRWLMRERELLTVDEAALLQAAREYAAKVDAFLASRERDTLRKLLAIGGLERGESYEVQVKAALPSEDALQWLLENPAVSIRRVVHYRQYDTFFLFDDANGGRVRYREDDLIGEDGQTHSVRSRLTYTVPTKERVFDSVVMLSRSRFIARADRPLRFYREYFQAKEERELHKDRRRWHLDYKGMRFYVNVDRLLKPAAQGEYLEIKSQTWSATDAEQKAALLRELLALAGIPESAIVPQEYVEMM